MAESNTPEGLLDEARRAADLNRWRAAFDAFASADDSDVLDLDDFTQYAIAGYLVGDVTAAVDALGRRYQRLLDAGERSAAAIAAGWAVFMLLNHGAHAQASGWMSRCTTLVSELPPDDLAHGYLRCFAAVHSIAVDHDYPAGHEAASDVITRARRHGDRDLLALGLNADGRALVRAGHIDEGMRRLDEAMVELVSGSLSAIVAGTVYCSLIEACEEIAEIQRAQEWTEALARWCERQEGMVTFSGRCLTHRASILRRQGRWEEAAAEAEEARERFEGAADLVSIGRAWYERGEIHRLQGESGPAEAAYRHAMQWGHDPLPGLALLRMAEGSVETAAAAMRRGLAEAGADIDRIRLLPAHVEIMLATGALAEAAKAAEELTHLASVYPTEALGARAAVAAAAVDLERNEPQSALIGLRKACTTWMTLQSPYEEARTRSLIGRACRAMGDAETAKLEEAAAAEIFDQLGAVLAAPEADGDHPLSTRELEVLALVATGLTNQQIADELFLAVKTIERHVGNILMKLGVPSRTAATSYAYQHGLI